MSDIAVLIPHFNNIDGLYKSLKSISDQYLVDVIIVDDGSMIVPEAVVLSRKFPKIKSVYVISFEMNYGIEHALNAGLQFIKETNKYKYVARLDCGDVCKPERFYAQVAFLKRNPDIYLVGTGVQMVDTEGRSLYSIQFPAHPIDIRNKMYVNNMFCHPTVMFRIEVLGTTPYYPSEYKYAEDYAFFFNIVEHYHTSNIPEILLFSEVNHKGISISKRKVQVKSRILIIVAHWKWNIYALYGLARSTLLYGLPYWFISLLKRLSKKVKY